MEKFTELFTPEDTANLLEVLKAVRMAAECLSEDHEWYAGDDPTECMDRLADAEDRARDLLKGMAPELRDRFLEALGATPEWLTAPSMPRIQRGPRLNRPS